jgi:hypothetical protein
MELFRKYWHVAVLFAAAIVVCIPSIFIPASIIGKDESIGDRANTLWLQWGLYSGPEY